MRVAGEHVQTLVACPHCGQMLEPWRAFPPGYTPGNSPPVMLVAGGHLPMVPGVVSHRSKVVAGVLGILLGSLGVHRFYLGYVGIGVLQIIVSVVTFGSGGIWGFVEGILCLVGSMRDVDGLPLRD